MFRPASLGVTVLIGAFPCAPALSAAQSAAEPQEVSQETAGEGPATPDDPPGDNPLIEQGQGLYEELRFEEALQTLSAALVRPGNNRVQSALIYRLLAFTYLALERPEEARGAYLRMLPLAAEFQLGSDVSPRWREFFGGVRSEWEAAGRPGGEPPPAVTIQHRSPAEAPPGQPIRLDASIDDPGRRVAELVLAYRQGTEAVFERAATEADGAALSATIPGEAVAPPLVEYYFEALDSRGLPIAARGDVAAPLRVAVAAESGESVVEQWWFWTIIGVVVAAGVVTGVVLATELSQQTGTFVITVE